MVFRVEIAPRAFEDLDEIATYLRERGSFEQAERWLNGMIEAIASLRDKPRRCPVAGESEDIGKEVRRLLHGRHNRTYKIYFSIDAETQTIRVFHVRHWARRSLKAIELQEMTAEFFDEPEQE